MLDDKTYQNNVSYGMTYGQKYLLKICGNCGQMYKNHYGTRCHWNDDGHRFYEKKEPVNV